MNSRRFFSVLGRVNAVILFVAGLLGVGILTVVLYTLIKEATRERHARNVFTLEGGNITESKTSLGEFESVEGISVLRAPLQSSQEYSIGSGSKEGSSTRNYLFYDPATASSYWLLPGFAGIISSVQDLSGDNQDCVSSSAPVKAWIYALVEKDTDKDGQLTRDDSQDIAISDPAGTHLLRVFTGVEDLNSVHLLPGENEAVVMYDSQGSRHAARVDIATGRVLSDTVLKPLSDPAPRAAAR